MTLSRMANMRGYSTSTETLARLCRYFQCDLSDVAQYVADDTVAQRKSPVKAPAKASKPPSEKKTTRRVTKRA
jgi:Cro/C1-type HTH DNA-binding domain